MEGWLGKSAAEVSGARRPGKLMSKKNYWH